MAPDPGFDDGVRRLLDPDSDTVDRMVSTALQRGRVVERGRKTTWRLAYATAAAAAITLAFWAWREPSSVAPSADDLVFTRAGEVVMIQSASGETLILGPRTSDTGDRPTGTGFVIVEGDTK